MPKSSKPLTVQRSLARQPSGKGFEFKPDGQLLRQLIDVETPMGIAYERSVGYTKEFHHHDRLIIVCPRGASRMRVTTKSPNATYTLNSTQVLLVPQTIEHDDEGLSAVYDTLALLPSRELINEAIKENGLGAREKDLLLSQCHLLKRSKWLDDILHRYFAERVLGLVSPQNSCFYLEKQIMNELMRLVLPSSSSTPRRGVEETSSEAVVALEFIESNLFEGIDLDAVAARAGVSVSTLLRVFKKELGRTPFAYIKDRRLDEALALLGTGDYEIKDVAILVGYDDISAFSKAFRQKFKKTPSEARR